MGRDTQEGAQLVEHNHLEPERGGDRGDREGERERRIRKTKDIGRERGMEETEGKRGGRGT